MLYHNEFRLEAVPLWIVGRSREIAEREKTRANFSFISPRSSLAAL